MAQTIDRIDTGRGPPVLFLHGIADSAAAWAGVIARLGPGVRWPDCGLWPHRERPDRVAAALRAFLQEG